MANGDYGEYLERLVEAAAMTERLPIYKNCDQNKINCSDQQNPSEWQRLIYLLGRCHIHYHRDWVIKLKLLWGIAFKFFFK